MSRFRCVLTLCLAMAPLAATGDDTVTLEKIMAHPDWIGRSPENPYWADDGQSFYYERKLEGSEERELLQADLEGEVLRHVVPEDRGAIDVGVGRLSRDLTRKVYSRHGDVYWKDLTTGEIRQLTRTSAVESDPFFMADDEGIAFERAGAFFVRRLAEGLEYQVADLRLEEDPSEEEPDEYLVAQQERLFDHVREGTRERDEAEERERAEQAADPTRAPPPFYLGDEIAIAASSLSPNGRWLLLVTVPAEGGEPEPAQMPAWVTESGDVEVSEVRAKVGRGEPIAEQLLLLDLELHAAHSLDISSLPGISEDPLADLKAAAEARANAEAETEGSESATEPEEEGGPEPAAAEPEARPVEVQDLQWSRDGERLAIALESHDNKDRWIATVDFENRALQALHHLHDPAWINYRYNDFGWLPDDETLFYLSEVEGYSGLYRHSAAAGSDPERLAGGAFVVSEPQLSLDGGSIYYRANPEHPGRYEVYRVDLSTGATEQVTDLGGLNSAQLSRDGSHLLIEHSSVTRPPEIYLQETTAGARAHRVTETVSAEFSAVEWTAPRILAVPSSHVDRPIYSRLYTPPPGAEAPGEPGPGEGRPAVVFVHGAGYLQNAHEGWSGYFREFMFHTLLTRRGYVVLDMDFRASAGYGRDWRTAIYRRMGTPELEDLEDGVAWLVANENVDPARVGVYGGSYGGFLTMMALFKEPDLFAAGAALRPVTDWAHYNHPYTSNILNTPELDPEAYAVSSPIEFAEGLERPLLICAPMLDDNVFFQDTVRLVQRLIELEKITFETALYPVEPHSFREPSSWLDEYRRIYNLFERYVRPTSRTSPAVPSGAAPESAPGAL